MPKFEATFETYNVREKEIEQIGTSSADENAYGYEVFLWRGLTIVDHFDSEDRPHNSSLTLKQARAAAREVVQDVKRGKAGVWFTEVVCGVPA